MKVTIYELLGLIKDGIAPKKIKYNDKIMYFKNDYYIYENKDYGIAMWDFNKLNDEVEIIEKKEIEELPPYVSDANLLKEVTMNRNKINEIVRKLKNLSNAETKDI